MFQLLGPKIKLLQVFYKELLYTHDTNGQFGSVGHISVNNIWTICMKTFVKYGGGVK